jgi:hypothetical protein
MKRYLSLFIAVATITSAFAVAGEKPDYKKCYKMCMAEIDDHFKCDRMCSADKE